MSARFEPWGLLPDGRPVERHLLSSPVAEVAVLTWGAVLQSIVVPDRDGTAADVALGHDDLSGYLGDPAFLGATVGRFANRIGRGRFVLDGVERTVPVNDGPNALHGGPEGFSRHLWEVTDTESRDDGGSVTLRLVSPDGEMGFPGELATHARFDLSGDVLQLELTAETDAPTVVNLTNHVYLNLRGATSGQPVDGHELRVAASAYLPVDGTGIPLAEAPVTVDGTPFDLRTTRTLAEDYDHCLVLDGNGLHEVAWLSEPVTGRAVALATDEPGVQVYTGQHLPGSAGKGGVPLTPRTGMCLETQHFPDAPNRPDFPSTVLRPGEVFRSTTRWRFTTS